jgi:hypothetical protein
LMAQYAHVIGRTRTIAGAPLTRGYADGPALSGAKFQCPSAVALDDTDSVAGPQWRDGPRGWHCGHVPISEPQRPLSLQLLISDGGAVRCLNLRTEMVTTIAGGAERGRPDGPASRAQIGSAQGIAVSPNGVVFVADRGNDCVRRIGAATPPASDATAPAAERMVTTVRPVATCSSLVQRPNRSERDCHGRGL